MSLIDRLFSYAGRSQRSLAVMQQIDAWLGHPHRRFASIHVAGTNGKGSVTTKIAAALAHAGYKTGLYTSPHLVTYRERIQINGALFDESFAQNFLPRLFAFIEKNHLEPTFFELLTALAFAYFADRSIDIAVVEVGLGGRLDATNILTPRLSIITSIDYDHTELLGHTLAEIAAEKGGILKPSVPAVIGPRARPFYDHAPLITVAPTDGFYDLENSAMARAALTALDVPPASIAYGLTQRPPCRFQAIGSTILDVAHNADGFRRLAQALALHHPQTRFQLVLALGKGKDAAALIEPLRPHIAQIVCVSNGHVRLTEADALARQIPGAVASALAQIDWTLPTLVCGSFFIMADVLLIRDLKA